jgi:hypothetical protein
MRRNLWRNDLSFLRFPSLADKCVYDRFAFLHSCTYLPASVKNEAARLGFRHTVTGNIGNVVTTLLNRVAHTSPVIVAFPV